MDILRELEVISLGHMDYREAWEIQEQMAKYRGADAVPDRLLFVEHPHTYPLGSSGHMENVVLSLDELKARGISIYDVNRGGDVTYHGPGQLVGYPIVKLPAAGDGLHADVIHYVRSLEQTLINALATYGIAAYAYPGYTGVWLDTPESPAKIAAIGVKVTTRRVTLHGFALNVNTDLDYFKGIIPCGISDKPVTSMQAVLGHPVDIAEVADRGAKSFCDIFGVTIVS